MVCYLLRYNQLNHVAKERSQNVWHEYFYDRAGRRIKSLLGAADGGVQRRFDTRHDEIGRTERITERSGESSAGTGRSTEYRYDLNGNLVWQQLPNNVETWQQFDEIGRLTSQKSERLGAANARTLIVGSEQKYDLVGNVRRVEEQRGQDLGGVEEVITHLVYDSSNRLKLERRTVRSTGTLQHQVAFGYDDANNCVERKYGEGTSPRIETLAYNHLNQLELITDNSGSAPTSYTYDGSGNRRSHAVGGNTTSYVYDEENRLVELLESSIGSQLWRYGYDYRGRRISRIVGAGNGVETRVVFSGGTSCMELVSSSGPETPSGWSLQAEFIRGVDRGGGVGGLLYSLRDNGATPRFAHYNGRGDVVAQTNQAGGELWQASYEAFGTHERESGNNPDLQRANTKEEDPTRLLNEGFRYRDLATGTFITRDPAGFVDGPNLYTYVRQNPWSKFDPEGLWAEDLVLGVPSLVMGGYSLWQNIKEGNVGGAVLDGAGIVGDVVGIALPGVPGGAGLAIKTGRMADKAADTARAADKATEANRLSKTVDAAPSPSAATDAAKSADEVAANTQPTGFCFVAGTLVANSEGGIPIEQLRVGNRVLTSDASEQDSSTKVDPEAWGLIQLHLPNPDGSHDELRFEILRSFTWIDAVGATPGNSIWFELPEMGVAGWATVDVTKPCPPLCEGPGRVVLSTMTHLNAFVLKLHFEGTSETLSPTDTHRLFSETRQAWVPAGELRAGEILRTQGGSARLSRIERLAVIHRVFNIEVETEHCYFVGPHRVLSHNDNPCAPPRTTGQNSAELGRNMAREGRPLGDGDAAAHIVPSTGTKGHWAKGAESRQLLEQYGVNVNDAANGARLGHPRPHNQTHTGAFQSQTNERLRAVRDSMQKAGRGGKAIRKELRRELRSIGRELENAQ